jgi:aspartyl-tRNA(Asn)/glutamyl-tRNA(Gln) amidotransferase subunit B
MKRQAIALDSGEKIIQETRGWYDDKECTFSQRNKEDAHEYRYFPEPDLPPLTIEDERIEKIRHTIPELPSKKRKRFNDEYGLDHKSIEFFVYEPEVADYFEKAASELSSWEDETDGKKEMGENRYFQIVKLCSNYIITDLQSIIKNDPDLKNVDNAFSVLEKKISPENFAEFICLIANNKITSKIAKIVLPEMYSKGKDPSQIIEDNDLSPIADDSELLKIVNEVIEKNPKPVTDYKAGKQNSLAFLIGQVMAMSRGKADPKKAAEVLKNELEK